MGDRARHAGVWRRHRSLNAGYAGAYERGWRCADRALYGYNALHWRTTRKADSNSDGTIDQANIFLYDASWRLLEERIADGVSAAPGTDPFAAFTASGGSLPSGVTMTLVQRVWGLGYIDELLYFHTDATPSDGDLSNASGYYALVDRLYSVIAVTNVTGALQERIRYSAYGVPTALDAL